jgi:transposase InsO family protein
VPGRQPEELAAEFACSAQSIRNWVAQAAIDAGRPPPGKNGLTPNADPAVSFTQYTSIAFGQRCPRLGVRPSMGSVGDAYDNAMAESFFASLECELIDRRSFERNRRPAWPCSATSRVGITHAAAIQRSAVSRPCASR